MDENILSTEELLKKLTLENAEKDKKLEEQKKLLEKKIVKITEESIKYKEESIKSKKESIKSKEENLKLKTIMEKIKTLKDLYKKGIGELTFTKTVTKSSDHTSKHKKIDEHISDMDISILSNIKDYITPDLENEVSTFLTECIRKNNNIEFSDEQIIHNLVTLFFNDIIKGSTLNIKTSGGSISAILESANITKQKNYRPDIWIVLKFNNIPLLAVEIKSPPTTNSKNSSKSALSDEKCVGQLYDYMIIQKSFYNQQFVFGILTTLDEWKICWLPDSNEYALRKLLEETGIDIDDSDSIDSSNTEISEKDLEERKMFSDLSNNDSSELSIKDLNMKNFFIKYNYKNTEISEKDLEERKMFSSIIYKHNEKNLSKIILSVLVKCYHSPKHPVDLLSTSRAYLRINELEWSWVKYKSSELSELENKLSFRLPDTRYKIFTVLRYFNGGENSKTRLVVSNGGHIIILKEFSDDVEKETVDQELFCWKNINKVDEVSIKTINNKRTLMLPLVFHVQRDSKDKKIYIPLDLKIWTVQDEVISGTFPKILKKINKQLSKMTINVREIAKAASVKCANQKYIHNDLKLSHIGVMPIFSTEGELKKLEPVFIDFGMMKKTEKKRNAQCEMNKSIHDLFNDYSERGYKFEGDEDFYSSEED